MLYGFYFNRETALKAGRETGFTPCIARDNSDYRMKLFAVIDQDSASIGNFWSGWVGMSGCYQFFPIRPNA